jgi:hypothetical protein
VIRIVCDRCRRYTLMHTVIPLEELRCSKCKGPLRKLGQAETPMVRHSSRPIAELKRQ